MKVRGQEYEPWLIKPSKARLQAYKWQFVRHVVRCDVLYVHIMDLDAARRLDTEIERRA